MSTTNRQLQEWLKQFPDNANIEVITTEINSGWEGGHSAYEVDLELKRVEFPDFSRFYSQETFELEGWRDANDKVIATTIRFGRKE